MALLQCEICGGKLKGRPGGIYECEFCGVEYDTAWAKAKIQQIKGTVKVEGTVQVAGTVKVDGPVKVEGSASKESLLKRAQLALEGAELKNARDYFGEGSDWRRAREYFEKVLDIDPECAEAYFGIAMHSALANTLEALVNKGRWEDKNYIKGKRFASPALLAQVEQLEQAYLQRKREEEEKERIAREKREEEERIAREKREEEERIAREKREEEERIAREKREEEERIVQQQREEKSRQLKPVRERVKRASGMILAGWERKAIAIRLDGSIITTGYPRNIGFTDWRNIVAVDIDGYLTVGLTSDGHMLERGGNMYTRDDLVERLSTWRNIIAISAGRGYVVGLMDDGRVVAQRLENLYSSFTRTYECDVDSWRNVVAISAGDIHTVGLKADGTVVATDPGSFDRGQCNVSSWRNIVDISAEKNFTVGLTSDGRVMVAGLDSYWQPKVEHWRDIVAISTGCGVIAGVTADGRVVSTNDAKVQDWRDIVAVSAESDFILGLTSAGRVLSTGDVDVSGWRLFRNLDTIEQERWQAASRCQHCGGEFKGLFKKTCTACGNPKDY